MKIVAVIGARPQFIKHAPLEMAFEGHAEVISVHTGQHYDANMSEIFFEQLGLQEPRYNLAVGSHTHGKQTALMMTGLEPILHEELPDAVVIYGDTNSTLAAALVASKLHIPVIHIEAGLRSFNRKMPEEINRVVSDHLSTLLFPTSEESVGNLRKEGIVHGVYCEGDVMRDMLRIALEKGITRKDANFGTYHLATIHRPYNTDESARLTAILDVFQSLDKPVFFPMHPRTLHLAEKYGLDFSSYTNIRIQEPAGYFEMMHLLYNAHSLITDSGGMQKEAYWLQKPCITVRSETEWVETLEGAWNVMIFDHLPEINAQINRRPSSYDPDLYGNGMACQGIVKRVVNHL